MARVGARTGASFVTSVGGDAAAAQALKVLGNLRGLAAKIGQTLSYVDGVVPEKHREAYERTLKELQRAAPTSPFEEVRATLEQELGGPLETLFTDFEVTPVASASIGQVHRARLPGGEVVAVKVQHAGIEQAFDSDLSNIGALTDWMRFLLPGHLDPSSVLTEVISRFREELDYQREASSLEAFGRFWRDEPGLVVPSVVRTRSSRRVLTTSWAEGQSLDQAALGSEDERRAWALHLWRFVFRSTLIGGAFHADPHPGNYAFTPAGGLVIYDFGCIQPLPEAARRAALLVHRGAVERNREGFRSGLRLMMETREGAFESAVHDYVELCFAPLWHSPFHITRAWVSGLTAAATTMKKAMLSKGSNPTLPPPYLAMMNRLQFGFFSVLARLNVEADYRSVELELLREAESPARPPPLLGP